MQDYKKRLRVNIIQLIVWFFLLWIVYIRVNKYPSERNAFKIQFSVLFDQAKIWFYSIFTDAGRYAKEKNDLVRSYESLLNISINAWCLSEEDIEDMKKFYNTLKNMFLIKVG